jgi:hypothetical protein
MLKLVKCEKWSLLAAASQLGTWQLPTLFINLEYWEVVSSFRSHQKLWYKKEIVATTWYFGLQASTPGHNFQKRYCKFLFFEF